MLQTPLTSREKLKGISASREERFWNRYHKLDHVDSVSRPSDPNSSVAGHDGKIYMPIELYRAATANNADHFVTVISMISADQVLDFNQIIEQVTPSENTVLHLAASHGSFELVELINHKAPSLVMKQNLVGDTALHLAVRAGHQHIIPTLIHPLYISKQPNNKLLRVRNKEGNTALHEFVIKQHKLLPILGSNAYCYFSFLIKEDPEVCYLLNNEGKSPLYLAAEAGKETFVKAMLEIGKIQICDELLKGKSCLLPAITTGNKGLVETILQIEPALINSKDEDGKTPLHHAASVGCIEIIKHLIEKDVQCALKRDNNGVFPVHIAAFHGHIQAMVELLKQWPKPEELLTSNCQNVLHVAAASGKYNVVRFLLKTCSCLVNERDENGNTPLHIATINWHPRLVSKMTWDKRVDLEAVNKAGLTALDVAEHNMGDTLCYEKVPVILLQ